MKIFKEVFQKKEFFQRHRKIFLVILSLALTSCIIYLCLLAKVLLNSNEIATKKADAVIILGHGVTEDLKPSKWLYERLTAGLYLYENGLAKRIIVTGGRGPRDTIPVSYVMRYFLISRGVSYENILTEANSRDTFENFSYSKILAKESDISSIIFVTNNFHTFRSKRTAMIFFEEVQAHSAPAHKNLELAVAFLREPASIMYNFLYNFFRGL